MKLVEIHENWRLDVRHNNYKGVCFVPTGVGIPPTTTVGGELNLFTGFAVNPDLSDKNFTKAQPFLKFIKDIICSGNSTYYEYLVNSLSQWFKQPEVKSGVAIILRSAGRGTGKSFFAECIAHLIGRAHTSKVSNPNDLTGDWNAHYATALLCIVEEAVWGGNKSAEGVLKDLITGNQLSIKKKFMDNQLIDNFTRFIFLTNNDWVVPAASDERRFFMLEVSEDQKQNHNYFKELTDGLKAGGYEQLLGYFLSQYSMEFDFRKAPITDALLTQIEQSFCSFGRFLVNMLSSGALSIIDKASNFRLEAKFDDEKETIVSKADFYTLYEQFVYKDRYGGGAYSKNQIPKYFKKYGLNVQERKSVTNTSIDRINCWVFPPLRELKATFTLKTGVSIN